MKKLTSIIISSIFALTCASASAGAHENQKEGAINLIKSKNQKKSNKYKNNKLTTKKERS